MQITEKQALNFINKINDAKSKTSFINGELGQELKDAAENGGFDLKALKDIARLGRIGEQRREAYLETFDALRDICRPLWSTEEHVGDLDKLARQKTGEADESAKRTKKILDEAARVADVSAQIGRENAAQVAKGIKQLEPKPENDEDLRARFMKTDDEFVAPPAPKKRGRPAKAKAGATPAETDTDYSGFN